jgi:hypothetical protein
MEFAPLFYVVGTLTVWHLAVWLTISALVGIVLPLRDGRPILWAWLPITMLWLAVMYGIIILAFGQVYGDKFTLATLWPTSALLGGLFVGRSIFGSDSASRPPLGLALVFSIIGAAFITFALWLLPRMAGLGLMDFPKLSWGVDLYIAP